MTTSQTYNSFGELETYTATISGAPIYSYTLGRDAGGRISEKIETIEGATTTWAYDYDPAGRLQRVEKDGTLFSDCTYDANGSRLSYTGTFGSFTGSYDAQDRVTTYGDTTFGYSFNGERSARTQAGHTISYGYDIYGNLRSVVLPDGISIDYVVDGQNRRVGKKINGTLTTAWLYKDGLNPIAALDGGDRLEARFVYGTVSNVPDYMVEDGKTYRVLADHLGSVRLVIDAASGVVAQRIDYDEFGRVLLDSNPGFQPFGFAGGLYDHQTHLVRFGARDYDPTTGLWTAKDPIRFGGGSANLYTYVTNDPVNLIDPIGLDPLPACAKEALGPYFPNLDLNEIEVHEGIPFVIRALAAIEPDAVTIGNDIYFAPGEFDTGSYSGMARLGHEVKHSDQYREHGVFGFWRQYFDDYRENLDNGMSPEEAYRNIPFEEEAYKEEGRIKDDLQQRFPNDPTCGCGPTGG